MIGWIFRHLWTRLVRRRVECLADWCGRPVDDTRTPLWCRHHASILWDPNGHRVVRVRGRW